MGSTTQGAPALGTQAADCLRGGGEMGALLRATDWSRTPVGPVESWPQSLRTAVSIMLSSRFGMYIAWGKNYTQFYNDAYRPILGLSKHPAAGKSSSETLAESWHIVGPLFDGVLRGEAVGADDWMLPLDRNGYLEECFFTYCYSPIRDETGEPGGVMVTVSETTTRTIGERRMRTLRALAARTIAAKSDEEVWRGAAEALQGNPADLPFAMLYALDGERASRMALVHLAAGSSAAPETVELQGADPWQLGAAAASGRPVLVTQVEKSFGALRGPCWPEPVQAALVLPLLRPGLQRPYGFAVLGISPRRALDEAYRGFLELAVDPIAIALSNSRAQQEALASEHAERARLAAFFAQAPLAVAILRGPEHRYELSNELHFRLAGSRELIGKSVREALPELAGQGIFELLDRVYRAAEPFSGTEIPLVYDRHGDGRLLDAWLNFSYQPLRDPSGQVSGIMVVAADVTEQVQARLNAEALSAQLRENEERLRLLVEASDIGTWELQVASGEVTANARFRELFGLARAGAITLADCLGAVDGEDQGRVTATVTAAMRGENAGRYTDEYRIQSTSPGPQRWVESRGQLRFGPEGKAVRLHGTVAEITSRKAAEALAQQRADFEQQLIGMVSHDLRSPLNAIQLSAELLARTGSLDDRAKKLVLRIRSSADRATRMIRDLLDFTQARLGGGIQLSPKPVDMQELVRGVLDEVTAAHPGREVRVVHQGGERGQWDPDRIAQVLQNLMVNALKYSPPEEKVKLQTWVDPGWLFLTVHNGGPAIPAEKLPRIFEPLQRAVSAADLSTRSIGLGLYIVRHIVEAHRGSIEVRSTAAEGTTFTLRLPRS